MIWVSNLGFEKIEVEVDAKRVFDALHRTRIDLSTFGDYIGLCTEFLTQNELFVVKLVRRNANDVAHILARVFVFYDSRCLWVEPSDFLDGLLDIFCSCNE
ncbi:hypothetical protein ACS0TY_034025 [Phlomoides rotata]